MGLGIENEFEESVREGFRVDLGDGFGKLILLLVGQVADVGDLVERHGDGLCALLTCDVET